MDEVTNHIEIHMPPPPLPHSLLSLLSLLPLPPFSPLISLLHSSLVYRLVGRMKEVRNQAAGKGSSYYQSLLLDSKSNVCVCCMVIACYEESHLLSFPSSPTLPSLCSLLCLLPSLLPLPPPLPTEPMGEADKVGPLPHASLQQTFQDGGSRGELTH